MKNVCFVREKKLNFLVLRFCLSHVSFIIISLFNVLYFHYSNHTESASTVENSNSTMELPWEEFWCVWFPNFSSSCLAQIESESKAFKNITTAAMKIIRFLFLMLYLFAYTLWTRRSSLPPGTRWSCLSDTCS